MASIPTNATDDIGSVVTLLGAVVFPMPDFSTILAGLVLIVPERTVERSKLTKLVSLEFVLAFGDGGSLAYHVSTTR